MIITGRSPTVKRRRQSCAFREVAEATTLNKPRHGPTADCIMKDVSATERHQFEAVVTWSLVGPREFHMYVGVLLYLLRIARNSEGVTIFRPSIPPRERRSSSPVTK